MASLLPSSSALRLDSSNALCKTAVAVCHAARTVSQGPSHSRSGLAAEPQLESRGTPLSPPSSPYTCCPEVGKLQAV
eukprot:2933426-Rhodomonas_salina.2